MSDLWLTDKQRQRVEPYFPLSHGVQRGDGRRIVSGIIVMIRNGLRWRGAEERLQGCRHRSCRSSSG